MPGPPPLLRAYVLDPCYACTISIVSDWRIKSGVMVVRSTDGPGFKSIAHSNAVDTKSLACWIVILYIVLHTHKKRAEN